MLMRRSRCSELAAIRVPAELQAVHAMLLSAVHMVRQAASLRQTAITSNTLKLAWDASSAAAGALLLWQRANDELASWPENATNPEHRTSTEENQRGCSSGDHSSYNPASAGAGSQNACTRSSARCCGASRRTDVVCRAGADQRPLPGSCGGRSFRTRPAVAREDVGRFSDTCRVLRPAASLVRRSARLLVGHRTRGAAASRRAKNVQRKSRRRSACEPV